MDKDSVAAASWRRAAAEAIDASGKSRAQVAEMIGRSKQQLSHWLNERELYNPPPPDVVFAIEDALQIPGELSWHLGYVRAEEVAEVEAAIRRTPGLSRSQRETLLVLYRSMQSTGRG
jgi:transcriptional regulator with XRE-family HTH domain